MIISLIVAASENNAIGKKGELLWSLPIDMRFFKDTTWGMVVIMGRKTYESVDKPLPGRLNIVITKQKDWKREGTQVAADLADAIKQAKAANTKEVFIIGGGEIYKQSMDIADKIYMTRVHANLEGDTYFPEIDESKWILEHNKDFFKDEKHAYDFSFQRFLKRH